MKAPERRSCATRSTEIDGDPVADAEEQRGQRIVGDESNLHPALLGAMCHRGRVGAREASATLVRLVGLGAVAVHPVPITVRSWGRDVVRETTQLTLVAAKAGGGHRRGGGPVVAQGHVGGLDHIDRAMLSLLFDRIAHGQKLTLAQIDDFSTRHPASYSSAIREWRELVADTAREKGLLSGGANALGWIDRWRLRREVREAIRASRTAEAAGSVGPLGCRLAELAVVFGLERSLVTSLRLPAPVSSDVSPSAGIEGIRWLCAGPGGTRAPVLAFRGSFTPMYSSGYPPAQSMATTMPTYGGGGLSGGSGGGGGFSSGGGDGGGGGGGGAG
jgi:hypothetical protein